MQWNPDGPEMPESAVSLDILRYSNSSLLALLLHFSVKMSIDRFSLEADYSFLNIKDFVLYIGIRILIDQNWQSDISIEISRYSNLSFSKTTHLKILSRAELMVICFQMFIRWNNE